MHDFKNPPSAEAVSWTQTEYDRYFMSLATKVSLQTDDPKVSLSDRVAVGALISKHNIIISYSANKLPPNIRGKYIFKSSEGLDRYIYVEHAERCALYDATISGKNLSGATIYCTRFPCSDCARAIVYFDIKRIVVKRGFSSEGAWVDSQRAALEMMRSSGVTVRYLSD